MTQAQMARELGLSRSTVHDCVQQGMPLTSASVAIAWRKEHGKARWHQPGTKYALPTTPPPVVSSSPKPSRKLTHEEFAALTKSEFERFETDSPKRKKNVPLSFSPSLMIAVWAIKGCMAYAKSDKAEVPLVYVNSFMEALRGGDGDLLFKGLAKCENEELSAEFLAEWMKEQKEA